MHFFYISDALPHISRCVSRIVYTFLLCLIISLCISYALSMHLQGFLMHFLCISMPPYAFPHMLLHIPNAFHMIPCAIPVHVQCISVHFLYIPRAFLCTSFLNPKNNYIFIGVSYNLQRHLLYYLLCISIPFRYMSYALRYVLHCVSMGSLCTSCTLPLEIMCLRYALCIDFVLVLH